MSKRKFFVLQFHKCCDFREHIRLGEYKSLEETDCDEHQECAESVQDIKIAFNVTHPEYNPKLFTNDIGIVRLAEEAKMQQNNIKPICLPLTAGTQNLPRNFMVIGWGRTGIESNSESKVLQKASVPLYEQLKCLSLYRTSRNTEVTERQFCAGGEGIVDSCRGDSGSAIQSAGLVNGKPRQVLFGVVSYGVSQCGHEGFPGVYTKVGSYLTWILDNTSETTRR